MERPKKLCCTSLIDANHLVYLPGTYFTSLNITFKSRERTKTGASGQRSGFKSIIKGEKTYCVCTIKITEVFYVYETIWHGRATISDKKLKKFKGFHLIKPCWHKSSSLSQNAFLLRFLLYRGNITGEVIGHVLKQIKGLDHFQCFVSSDVLCC